MTNKKPPRRILKITYRSGVNGRVARVFAKVPYGGVFDLTEKMARMYSTGQIRWFRIDEASPAEINENRSTLGRWLGALAESSAVTRVDWLA